MKLLVLSGCDRLRLIILVLSGVLNGMMLKCCVVLFGCEVGCLVESVVVLWMVVVVMVWFLIWLKCEFMSVCWCVLMK